MNWLNLYNLRLTPLHEGGVVAEIREQVETLLVILSALKSANHELHPERFKVEKTGLAHVTWAELTDRERAGLPVPLVDAFGDWLKAHFILCNRLRQLSGLDNPEMATALAQLRETLSKAHAEEMEALRRSLGMQAELEKEQAIKQALGSIANRLVG